MYSHLVSDGTEVKFIEGKKFDCASGMPYLKKFGLLSNQILQSSPVDPKNVVFAIAADSNYYESSRAVIAAIKKHFGEEARIIFYDLGRILDNEKYVRSLSFKKIYFYDVFRKQKCLAFATLRFAYLTGAFCPTM